MLLAVAPDSFQSSQDACIQRVSIDQIMNQSKNKQHLHIGSQIKAALSNALRPRRGKMPLETRRSEHTKASMGSSVFKLWLVAGEFELVLTSHSSGDRLVSPRCNNLQR